MSTPANTPGQVPAQVTAAVVAAFRAPWTSSDYVPGTRNPREYIETVHVPSGADATMVVEPGSDGHNSIRSLTFNDVLAVAYPVIVAHLNANPDAPTQTLTPGATVHRPTVNTILDELATQAQDSSDPALSFAVEALRTVHDLYPDADTVTATGTWQSRARTDIHNAIVDAAINCLDTRRP